MNKHPTADKGDLAVYKAQLSFAESGYYIFTTISEHLPFDFIAYKNGKCLRVQVKYISIREGKKTNGALLVDISSSGPYQGKRRRPARKDEIDLVVVYCPNNKRLYFIPIVDFSGDNISLRVEPAKNNQQQRVHLAEDYSVIPGP